MGTSISELANLTEREKRYRMYERMHEAHSNGHVKDYGWVRDQDFKLALFDKWGMLAYADSNPFLG